MPPRSGHRPRPPLDAAKLEELALRYVGRFATSRGKLVTYLDRKVRERGWVGEAGANATALAARLADMGYVDDAAFALSKARALTGRGLGGRRVGQALHAAGISDEDGSGARDLAHDDRVEAAVRLARKRRIGPFAASALDQAGREKALGAMIRGGHSFALARAIVALPPGSAVDRDLLAEFI